MMASADAGIGTGASGVWEKEDAANGTAAGCTRPSPRLALRAPNNDVTVAGRRRTMVLGGSACASSSSCPLAVSSITDSSVAAAPSLRNLAASASRKSLMVCVAPCSEASNRRSSSRSSDGRVCRTSDKARSVCTSVAQQVDVRSTAIK